MAKTPLAEQSTDVLRSRLAAVKTIHGVTSGIFLVIIAAWVFLGSWRTNLPVFISTIAMAVAITVMQRASRSSLTAELARREKA